MPHYRKVPVEIEAVRWTGDNLPEIAELTQGSKEVQADSASSHLFVHTLEGRMRCSVGDWLIKGVEGGFYAVANEEFQGSYEEIVLDAS